MTSEARPNNPISPKVAAPALTLAIATVVSAIVSGDFSGSETALAIATIVTAVVGYFIEDPARR